MGYHAGTPEPNESRVPVDQVLKGLELHPLGPHETALEAFVLAVTVFDLQELIIRSLLNLDEVRHLRDLDNLAERLAESLRPVNERVMRSSVLVPLTVTG